jgi:hypothetical protein
MGLGRHELVGVQEGVACRAVLCGKLIEGAHLNQTMWRFDIERDHDYVGQRLSRHIESVRVFQKVLPDILLESLGLRGFTHTALVSGRCLENLSRDQISHKVCAPLILNQRDLLLAIVVSLARHPADASLAVLKHGHFVIAV